VDHNGKSVTALEEPGDAPDVAFHWTWSGQKNPDARYFCSVQPRELPWPLQFGFVQTDTAEWVCVSVEIGRAILRSEDGLELDDVALTAKRWRIVRDNFDRYRRMAELKLIPTQSGDTRARRIRRGMRHKPRERWTEEQLVNLAQMWRALEGEPSGRMWELAGVLDLDRSTVYRALRKAEEWGILEPDELPRRRARTGASR
jgi:hypothetical protein